MDTTRADALTCYQQPAQPAHHGHHRTPRLDALAASGIRFERFFATAPSTLSSHATMLSGVDQHTHAVVRNGFPLSPELPTLPKRLHQAGYDTIAVLGAAALESAMGLGRGFRVYDDDLSSLRGIMYQDPADVVVERTLRHVDARPDDSAPLFLMVHFYDPHAPYAPPKRHLERVVDPDYTGRVSGNERVFAIFSRHARQGLATNADLEHASAMYLAEVAFMDEQIGRLLDALSERGVLDHALVVVVADHGETLSDDLAYAYSHGSNVSYEAMWVPLIVRGFGLPLAESAVVKRQASMTGLAPTIERALGLDATLGTTDFYDLWRAGPVDDVDGWPSRPTHPVFMEATRPRHAEVDDDWNNLRMPRAVLAGGWGAHAEPFLDRPLAFYELGLVPHEKMLETLGALLQRWDVQSPGYVEGDMAPATREALEALGYLE